MAVELFHAACVEMLKRRLQVLSFAVFALFIATFIYTTVWVKTYSTGRTYKNGKDKTNGGPWSDDAYSTEREARSKSYRKKTTLHNFVYKTAALRTRNNITGLFEPDLSFGEEQRKYESWFGTRRSFFEAFMHGVHDREPIVKKENYNTWATKWVSLTDRGIEGLGK